MKRLATLLAAVIALAAAATAQAQDLPVAVNEDTSACPNHTIDVFPPPGAPVGRTTITPGFWTPAGSSCRMTLDGATGLAADAQAYFGLPNADGDLAADVSLIAVDNATGEELGSCSDAGTHPLDGYLPGLSVIAGCRFSVSFAEPRDLDVTLTASGTGIGNYEGNLR